MVPYRSLSWPSPLMSEGTGDLARRLALDVQSQRWLNPAMQWPSEYPTSCVRSQLIVTRSGTTEPRRNPAL